MKIPSLAPSPLELLQQFSPERRMQVLLPDPGDPAFRDERYLHWDELRRREPPAGWTSREWWAALRLRRAAKPIPLLDRAGALHVVGMPDPVVQFLERDAADLEAGDLPAGA